MLLDRLRIYPVPDVSKVLLTPHPSRWHITKIGAQIPPSRPHTIAPNDRHNQCSPSQELLIGEHPLGDQTAHQSGRDEPTISAKSSMS
jgi:hypothetical protein